MKNVFDIIVIGAGHAGSEAAAAAARMGSQVLLITLDMTKIAQMSCNPAMGGIAKGQIIREIDALGGLSAKVTDKTMIQFRMLNRSKGPAMWSPRAQNDRMKFSWEWRMQLEKIPNLYFWQDQVKELIIEDNTVKGVKTKLGVKFYSKAVIITAGTFLNGIIHIGGTQISGGRMGDPSATGLSDQILALGIETGRMKTGTPPRIDGRTINFSVLTEQKGDNPPGKFSFDPKSKMVLPERSCWITYTNTQTHNELKKGFKFSPLFNGTIKGIGPRYCPSIEDKLVTFPDRDSHQLFLEPEGTETVEYYLNGFSSSLPLEVQVKALRKIPGLEKAEIFRPAYAIEYDFFQPTQLYHTLESKYIRNLYFAGQVNGTTGYEEAAAQGIIAGINAHLKINDKEPLILKRDQAYIGVLIDDLVTKGVDEPYRMFTSRAEFRILLRQDNADQRLTPIGYDLGLIDEQQYQYFNYKYQTIKDLIEFIKQTSITPDQINGLLKSKNSTPIKQSVKLERILLRPQISLEDLIKVFAPLKEKADKIKNERAEILQSVEINIKYQNYIEREKLIAEKIKKLENLELPENFDYNKIPSISTEARQKLNRIKPRNIAQASRIPGVSPSDINNLLIFLGR